MERLTALVIFVLAFSFPSCNAYPHAVFSPHQFAVLDSNVTFTAKIIDPNYDEYYIYWTETTWNPRPNPRHYDEVMSKENKFESSWTLDFPADEYLAGNYSLSANIMYKRWGLFPEEFDAELVTFTLTQGFTGRMIVNNVTKSRKSKSPFLVNTKNETVIKIDVDSADLLSKATNVTWAWYNNVTNIANTTGPLLKYNFTDVKTYEITAKVEVVFNHTLNATAVITKNGNFSANVTAKVPIMNVNVSGDTWYRNDGRLLRIKINCEGTGPYQYCLILKEGAYNITGNETCKSPEMTNDCEIPFAWLLGEGIHTLVTIIENDLGRFLNQTAIHVYKVARVQPLSLILVPITCSLIALVLIIFGIGYFWENRRRFNVEVADFDFGQHDELPYMTFMERLKDAMSSSALNRQRYIPPPDDHEPILSSRRSS